jgi:hypothetical protein
MLERQRTALTLVERELAVENALKVARNLAIAQVTGVTPRTVRKWLAPPEAENHALVPYAAWRLLLIETGVVPTVGIPAL